MESSIVNATLLKPKIFMAVAAIALTSLASTTAPAGAQILSPGLSTSCQTPDGPATPLVAVVPEKPVVAASMDLTGTTLVQVDLDASGEILDAHVMKSSGTPMLDRAAVASVKASTFRPEVRGCVAVAGSYLMEVDFPE
jgi:TonB family protein